MGVAAAVGGGGGLGSGGVDGGRGGPLGQGPVGPVLVVLDDEQVEQGLQFGDRGGLDGLGAQPLLQRLLDAFDLAAGGGVIWGAVLLHDAQPARLVF